MSKNSYRRKVSITSLMVIGSILFFVLIIIILSTSLFNNILLDMPIIKSFLYGVDKPAGFDASEFVEPITWEDLDNRPDGWSEDSWWFDHINNYSRNKLKQYMKENNFYIVPKLYADLHTAISPEELYEMLEFGDLNNIEK